MKTVVCSICIKEFSRTSSLTRHNRTVHLNLEMVSCSVCKKSMRKDNLKQHLHSHTVKNEHQLYLCEVCGNSYSEKEFQSHKKSHGEEEKIESPSVSTISKMCPDCSIEVPENRWKNHERTIAHKLKVASAHESGFKVVKSSFKERIETLILENEDSLVLDPNEFLSNIESKVIKELARQLQKHSAYKFNLELFAEYVKMSEDDEEFNIKSFHTKMQIINHESQLLVAYKEMIDQILNKMSEFQDKNSSWTLIIIHHLEINLNSYHPIRGSSYLPLPKCINNKKACVNIRNNDQYCFKWAIIASFSSLTYTDHANRMSSYKIENIHSDIIKINNHEIHFGNLEFPLELSDIAVFEKLNPTISITVFGIDTNNAIEGPYYHASTEKQIHINLLLIFENEKSHYIWIKNISRLMRSQLTKHHGQIRMCNYCLLSFSSEEQLTIRKEECNKTVTKMPSLDKNILKFEKYERSLEVPFTIYADFECILKTLDSDKTVSPTSSSTINIQQHVPCAFAYFIKCLYDDKLSNMRLYQGMDSPKKFVQFISEDVSNIYKDVISKTKKMTPLTAEEINHYYFSETCSICNKPINNNDKVKDHCHITGKYRGAAHNQCNLRYQVPNFIPVFFHNFSGYDCHLFVKALNEIEGEINLIPLNKELYISLTKRIPITISDSTDYVDIRFLDSARFMPTSLDKLARNLSYDDFHTLKSVIASNNQLGLLIRKGVFPYEYLDSFEKLFETALPSQINFNNKLTNQVCSDDDYNHAKTVWEKFRCVNLGDYLKIYLITDVLLLTDVFQNFRKICYSIYNLDPCHFYTAPGLAWEAMLKYTEINLELFTDVNMYNFIKKGIRGGITQVSHRHSLANNKYMENFDSSKPSRYLVYLDVNNLYGWAMCQPLPYGEFTWVDNVEDIDIMSITANSEVGYIFEVDLEYPQNLHDSHNDLPFCSEFKSSPISKTSKLILDLNNKTKYIIHYRNLQQCLQHGLKLVKIHRVLQFKQACWLKKYIDLNTFHRTNAKNDFEKDYFKLKNNAVYGKTMENVDKRKDIRIVTQWLSSGKRLGARALIAKPNFHSATQFTQDMVAIQLNRVKTYYNKPIYLGFTVLELSKWLMYDFHYNYMKHKYEQRMLLNYMDTDSLTYTIFTLDFYEDIKKDILTRFDTSEYDPNNIYNIPLLNKKVVGMMKDENKGKIMVEFIGLKAKMYSMDVFNKDVVKKAKGVKKTAVDGLSLDDYRDCLYKKIIFYSKMLLFRSKIHEIYTQKINKISLNYADDKRYIREDGISTYAWGHYRIE